MSQKIEGDERYTFTAKKVIHKIKPDKSPDIDGAEYHVTDELEDGYIVYVKAGDPSQPSPSYFIHKKYFV